MSRLSALYRPPAGMGMRTLLAAYLIAQGVGYWGVVLGGARLTTTYAVQAAYMPLWVYALISTGMGVALALTRRHRRTWQARAVAGGTLIFQAYMLGTYLESNAFTAAAVYVALIWASTLEVGFIEEL